MVYCHKPRTLDHGTVKYYKSDGRYAGRYAIPCMMATDSYYFPVVIIAVLVLCLRLSTKVSKSTLPHSDITLSCPAGYTNSTKDTLTCYLPKPEVHSICNEHNCPLFVLHFCWSRWSGWSRSTAFTTSPAILLVLPSPLPHDSLTSSSPYWRKPSPQYLPTFSSLWSSPKG